MIVLDTGKGKATAEALAKKSETPNVGTAYIKYGEAGSSVYKINTAPEVKNTVFVYHRKKVTTKFVNFVADEAGMKKLATAIDAIDK